MNGNLIRFGERLRCCSQRSWGARMLLVAVVWIAFSVLYLGFETQLGGEVGALAVIPVGVSAILFGRPGGLAAGLLFVPFNGLLHVMNGESFNEALDTGSLVGALAVLLVGVIVGTVQQSRHEIRTTRDDLERARSRFESVYNGVPVGLYRTSLDGVIVDCNNVLARLLGFENPTEAVGRTAIEFYADPTERDRLISSLESDRVMEGVEVELRTVDGKPIWARDHAHAVEGEDGATLYFEGVLEDITAERETRQAYALSEQRFRDAFTKAPIGMAIIETDGTLLEVNQALADQLGFDVDEMAGLKWATITHPDDIADNEESMREIVQGIRDVQRVEKRYIHKDGHIVWALMNATAVRKPSGEAAYLIGQVVDLSDRIRAEHALQELVRSKDEFIASVSHELRTPLTVVHGLAMELRDHWSSFSTDEAEDLVSMVVDQSGEIANLVEDLLVSARTEAGSLSVHLEDLDVREQIERVLESVGGRFAEHLTWAAESLIVTADPTRFRQIIRNLITNADRYGGENLQIVSMVVGRMGVIRVIDDGAGVAIDQIDRVFEPYARAHDGPGQPAAVGLGLTVSRKLARLMGGDLTYRYEADRSVFELTIPAAEVAASTVTSTGSSSPKI